MQKMCPKTLVPDPFFILVNNPKQPFSARNSFKNKIKGIIKNLWKSKLPSQSLLMDKIIKNKWALELVTIPSSGYKTSAKNFFISYILSHQVWWYNMKRFLSYSKNYTFKFMQANAWHLNYSTSICPFESGKKWKGRGKNIKIWISQERKKLFRWNKNHFSVFEGLSFGEKVKIW